MNETILFEDGIFAPWGGYVVCETLSDCLSNTTTATLQDLAKCADFSAWGQSVPPSNLCACDFRALRTGTGCQSVEPVAYFWVAVNIVLVIYEALLSARVTYVLVNAKLKGELKADTVMAVLLLCILASVLLSWWVAERILAKLPGPRPPADRGRVIAGLAASANALPEILVTTVWGRITRASDKMQQLDLARNQVSRTIAMTSFCVAFGATMTVLAFISSTIVTVFMLFVYLVVLCFYQAKGLRLKRLMLKSRHSNTTNRKDIRELQSSIRKISASMIIFVFSTVIIGVLVALPSNRTRRFMLETGIFVLELSLAAMTTAIVLYASKPLLRRTQARVDAALSHDKVSATKFTTA